LFRAVIAPCSSSRKSLLKLLPYAYDIVGSCRAPSRSRSFRRRFAVRSPRRERHTDTSPPDEGGARVASLTAPRPIGDRAQLARPNDPVRTRLDSRSMRSTTGKCKAGAIRRSSTYVRGATLTTSRCHRGTAGSSRGVDVDLPSAVNFRNVYPGLSTNQLVRPVRHVRRMHCARLLLLLLMMML